MERRGRLQVDIGFDDGDVLQERLPSTAPALAADADEVGDVLAAYTDGLQDHLGNGDDNDSGSRTASRAFY